MSMQNKIFTTANQPLGVQMYSLGGATPQTFSTLEGLPLGTADNSGTGEIGVKVINIGGVGSASIPGFVIPPYDEIDLAMWGSTNNLKTVTYKKATVTVATLDLTYVGGGAADNDVLLKIAKS